MDKQELLKCIGCGFCLNACPEYKTHRHEARSPRGIVRMLLACERRDLPVPLSLIRPCVDCLKCESACPVSLDVQKGFGLDDIR